MLGENLGGLRWEFPIGSAWAEWLYYLNDPDGSLRNGMMTGDELPIDLAGATIEAHVRSSVTSETILVAFTHDNSRVQIAEPITTTEASAIRDVVLKVEPIECPMLAGSRLRFGGATVVLREPAAIGDEELRIESCPSVIEEGATAATGAVRFSLPSNHGLTGWNKAVFDIRVLMQDGHELRPRVSGTAVLASPGVTR